MYNRRIHKKCTGFGAIELDIFHKKPLPAGQRTAIDGEKRPDEIEQIILGIDRQRRYNEKQKEKRRYALWMHSI